MERCTSAGNLHTKRVYKNCSFLTWDTNISNFLSQFSYQWESKFHVWQFIIYFLVYLKWYYVCVFFAKVIQPTGPSYPEKEFWNPSFKSLCLDYQLHLCRVVLLLIRFEIKQGWTISIFQRILMNHFFKFLGSENLIWK